jgi:amidase
VNQPASGFRVPRDQHHFSFSRTAEPVLHVPSGSTIILETLDCFSNRITSGRQRYAREHDLLAVLGAYNPVTGPVYVQDAEPGDVLAVSIENIQLGTAAPYAVTVAFGRGSNYVSAACPGIPRDGDTKTCRITAEQQIVFPASHGDLILPARPMIGTIRTAPAGGPLSALLYHSLNGGNMDCPLITTGSVLYLPVSVPGALLSLGDVHALMGDAELTGTALEASADVTVTVTVLPAGRHPLTLPHLDTPELIGTIGCVPGATLEQNLEAAT